MSFYHIIKKIIKNTKVNECIDYNQIFKKENYVLRITFDPMIMNEEVGIKGTT
jgi:hypothetical protein